MSCFCLCYDVVINFKGRKNKMNTIIAINWARNMATISFTDIEDMGYTFSLGEVTTLSGAKARIRRVLFKQYGITLSRMKLEKSTTAIDYFRSNRVED